MSWKSLKIAYKVILDRIQAKECFDKEWKKFKKISEEIQLKPPPAVKAIHYALNKIEKNIDKSNIFILDHGCGGGLKSMYLAALGYKNVFGVNVNFDVNYLNLILHKKFKIKKERFIRTEGKKVPFPDNFFDFIISSQVVEHITERDIYLYYSEQGRVLKKNGFAYHEVPHKFIPYESHSRLWFIHLFPYFCKPILYGIFISIQKKKNLFLKGNYYAEHFSKKFLILRTPYFHKKMLKKNIGDYEDLNYSRLTSTNDFSSYDHDSPIGLRKLIQKVFNIPILGKICASIFKNFFILLTLTKKS